MEKYEADVSGVDLRKHFYDYTRWLYIMEQLAGFIIKPRNIKAMFRYRWMANYLAVPMMVDKHTQGLRGPYLRMCHLEQDLVVYDVAKLLDNYSAEIVVSAMIKSS